MDQQNYLSDREGQDKIERNSILRKVNLKRVCQLQNKAYFFEGQVNPLFVQNQKLKEQLTFQNKSILFTTDLLRNLLPVGTDPNRKLKLQMASLEEISQMIKQDWFIMKNDNYQLQLQNTALKDKITALQQQLKESKQNYERIIEDLQSEKTQNKRKYEALISQLKCQLENEIIKKQKAIREITESFEERIKRADQIQRDFYEFQRTMNSKIMEMERANQKLKDQIQSNLQEFEQSKKNLKEIYQKLMEDKIAELNEGFDLMMLVKENQKQALRTQIQNLIEQNKRAITEKNLEIKKLETNNNQLKQEVGKCKDELWKKELQIDDYKKSLKEAQTQLFKVKNIQSDLKKKISKQAQQLEMKTKEFLQSKQRYENQIKNLIQNSNEQIKILTRQRQQLNAQIENQKKQMEATREEFLDRQRNYRKIIRQKQQQWEAEKATILQETRAMENIIKQKQEEIQKKINMMEQLKIKHQNKIRQIEKNNDQKMSKLAAYHETQMQQLQNRLQRKFDNERAKFEEQIKYIRQQATKQIQLMAKQQSQQMQALKKQHQQLLQQKLQEIQSIKQVLQQTTQQLQAKQALYESTLKKLNESQQARIQQAKKHQQQLRLKDQIYQKQMKRMNEEMMEEMSKMKNQLQKEIGMLRQSNAVEQIEDKFLKQIQFLKLQNEEEMNKLRKNQEQFIKQLQKKHNQDMIQLSNHLQSDISKLNDELLKEVQAHELSKMSRQQKIDYLKNKINEIKKIIQAKEIKIIQLEIQIQRYEAKMQKVQDIIKQQIDKIAQEMQIQKQQYLKKCNQSIEKSEAQCRIMVKKIQEQRIKFSESIYRQFYQIKQFHINQLNQLQKKYDELEKLFFQRPSRAEDLSKIKQLIEQKVKMETQVRQCQIKVINANEIVRYLHLELENYKSNYDIFGPNDAIPEQYETSNQVKTSVQKAIIMLKKNIRNKGQSRSDTHQIISQNDKKRKFVTQTPQIKQIKQFSVFPRLKRNRSVVGDQISDQGSNNLQYENDSILLGKRFSPKLQQSVQKKKQINLDKSIDVAINAQHFFGILKQKKSILPVEKLQKKQYRRRSINRIKQKEKSTGQGGYIITNDKNIRIKQRQSFIEKNMA